ncbi:spore maturation protein CgeB [Desulfovibrio intestinalis]|uniref:Spore maturation protein CgeB n=2 Tax=Desulfovibrio intestinalis TaxID=58621 RepID=A0A7W8C4S2_9BACT|nr:spore maturation protein CgeB [Desulfovibrio intestinalis]
MLMLSASLRILVVLPMYGGSLPIGRYCARALEEMGHSVRTFEAPLMFPAFTGLQGLGLPPAQTAQLENSFLQVVSQAVWAQVQAQEPHLVLALAQAPMGRSLLQRLKRAGVRTAMWFVEDHTVFQYWRAYAPLYDVFAIIQKQPFMSQLAEIGQNNFLYLPMAAHPDFHKPTDLSSEERREYGADIGFLGAGYPNRRLAFRPLLGRNFKIWGSDWEGENLLAAHVQRGGARIDAAESVKIYNATKVNLNLHSSLHTTDLVSRGDFVNPRTFELAAMNAFQLLDERSLLPELFAPGELATFGTIEEFYAKIDYFLAHPEERISYAARAQERVLRDHTYTRRMQTLLEFIAERMGPWPEAGVGGQAHDENGRGAIAAASLAQSLPPDLTPELAADLAATMSRTVERLGLGPNADFDSVVTALRARSGVLDEMETCLLFLDEWRKQYTK